jgi:4'-phosphopantetheinyl transferase
MFDQSIFYYAQPKQCFRLWIFQQVADELEPADILNFLTDDELLRLKAMTDKSRRRVYRQTRYQLKKILAEILNLPPREICFKDTGEGKPVLDLKAGPNSTDFNLSHNGDYFAVVISDHGRVGVDIEKFHAGNKMMQIAERFFSEEEQADLRRQISSELLSQHFTQLWAGKEAVIKAAAGGVFKNIHEVHLDLEKRKFRKLPTSFGPARAWSIEFFDVAAGYACAVAFTPL